MSAPMSARYEQAATEQERSPVPVLLRVARGAVWVAYAVVVVKVLFLATAFVLRALGASTDAAFTRWVYRSADRSMSPFRGIFPTAEVGESSIIDTSLLVAAVVYVFVALLLDLALRWLTSAVVERERRVDALRAAAYDAAVREYDLAQQLAMQEHAARVAAAAAVAATRSDPTASGPSAAAPPPPG